jgi:hypothetical protein
MEDRGVNPELEQELEREISRVLQGLPELAAPRGFAARTMSALERPAPRRLRSWATWPMAVRIAFLSVALAGVVVAVVEWRAVEPGLLAAAYHSLAPVLSGVKCLGNVLTALAGAVPLCVEHLGKGFILAAAVAALFASAVCAGFGTLFVRFALTRSVRSQL